jgi:uncharacterized membrane protein YhaH (DUF805 family)
MDWYLMVVKRFADFSGRSQRAEYWYFVLFNFIISFVLGFVDGLAGTIISETGLGILGILYGLFILIPSISVGVRRLHDTGRSGWWLLIGLIPIIGAIVLIIFFIQDSQSETNTYGPNPKMSVAVA